LVDPGVVIDAEGAKPPALKGKTRWPGRRGLGGKKGGELFVVLGGHVSFLSLNWAAKDRSTFRSRVFICKHRHPKRKEECFQYV